MKTYQKQSSVDQKRSSSKAVTPQKSPVYQKAPQPSYEGKASRLWAVVGQPDKLIIERKDDVTKLDGEVRSNIEGKGAYTNRISNALFRELERCDIPTHFIEELSPRETVIRKAMPYQLEVIVRNYATGSLCRRLPFEDGAELARPLVELDYKDDNFHDPLINDQHAILLDIVEDYDEVYDIEELALCVNSVLWDFFQNIGIILVDLKLEFGRTEDGTLMVIDEISPDTCRLWDAETKRSLDKDIFRKGKGNDATFAAYREVFERMIAK